MNTAQLLNQIEGGLNQLDKLEHLQCPKARREAREALKVLRFRLLQADKMPQMEAAAATLYKMGYTYHGGALWESPIGAPALDTQLDRIMAPDAMRWNFDGYGWCMIDNGSGADWATRHPDAEPMYARSTIMEALTGTKFRLPRAEGGQFLGFTVVLDPEMPPGMIRLVQEGGK